MNQTYLTIAAATVAVILAMALVFVPSLGFGSVATTQTTSNSVSLANTHHHSILDDVNLVMPTSLAQLTPQQAYAMGGPTVKMNLVAIEKNIQLPAGVSSGDGCGPVAPVASCLPNQIVAYTFNGTIPGPVIRAMQGQIINLTIWDPSTNTDSHSTDNHASITSATNFLPTPPGTHSSYIFMATQPGVWEYHCEGHVNDLAEHVFRGMHGMVIVDPTGGYGGYSLNTPGNGNALTTKQVPPIAKEIALDFSEYYTDSSGDFSWQAMYNHNVTYAHINGIPYGYQALPLNTALSAGFGNLPSPTNAKPLEFNVNDHVRFFLLNTGDYPVNFHIVGEILDRVTQGGSVQYGVQTFNLGGSNGAVIDVTFQQAGAFVIVNHDYSQLFKGQVATILVGQVANPTVPSNAIPPLGSQSLAETPTPYTFGTAFNNWNGVSAPPANQQPTGTDNTFCPDTC